MVEKPEKANGAVENCHTIVYDSRVSGNESRTGAIDPACGFETLPAPLPYIYRWNRQDRKGQECEVLARGKMNSCCVRFADGYTMVTSRNALMKNKARLTDPA